MSLEISSLLVKLDADAPTVFSDSSLVVTLGRGCMHGCL